MLKRRTVLAALASVPVLAACSPGSSAPQLELERVWAQPVSWDAARGVDYLVDRLSLVGDTIVYAEGTERVADRIVVLDAASGERQWSTPIDEPMTLAKVGPVRLSGGGRVALGPFDTRFENPVLGAIGGILPLAYLSGSYRQPAGGVIGVQLSNGDLAWGSTIASDPSTERAVITVVADPVVIVTVTTEVGPDWPAADKPVSSLAVDGRTGQILWSKDDVVGLGADGEYVVVGHRELRSSGRAVWKPEVLHARTGLHRWTGDQELKSFGDYRATAAGCVVVNGYEVHRLATGERIDQEWPAQPVPIMTDPPLLAWDSGDDWWSPTSGFHTLVPPDGKPQHGRGRPGGLDFEAKAGVGPYVWGQLGTTQGTWEKDAKLAGVVAVDRSGTLRSPSLPGVFVAVNDRWLITVDSKGFATYRIRPA